LRDWRIWSDLAAVLIRRARKLYADDALDNTVYALDSSIIDLCLSLFAWTPFEPPRVLRRLQLLRE